MKQKLLTESCVQTLIFSRFYFPAVLFHKRFLFLGFYSFLMICFGRFCSNTNLLLFNRMIYELIYLSNNDFFILKLRSGLLRFYKEVTITCNFIVKLLMNELLLFIIHQL